MDSAFKVKLVTDGVLGDCRFRCLQREGRQAAGKSFGNLVSMLERFVSGFFFFFFFLSGLCLLCLSNRPSLGPPGGRPRARLKASAPHEAPTPAPTTKTLVPTTVSRRSARAEATRRAPTSCICALKMCRTRAGIMEADDRQVTTVFTVQSSFHHRHSTNPVS